MDDGNRVRAEQRQGNSCPTYQLVLFVAAIALGTLLPYLCHCFMGGNNHEVHASSDVDHLFLNVNHMFAKEREMVKEKLHGDGDHVVNVNQRIINEREKAIKDRLFVHQNVLEYNDYDDVLLEIEREKKFGARNLHGHRYTCPTCNWDVHLSLNERLRCLEDRRLCHTCPTCMQMSYPAETSYPDILDYCYEDAFQTTTRSTLCRRRNHHAHCARNRHRCW